MIICKSVRKQYRNKLVLDDFSYSFSNTGFYLLYGESGSGKTTFINILAGMIPFEGGIVTVDGRAFDSFVDLNDANLDFDYITQDTFFADFLTVLDNLKLINEDENRIKSILSRFGIEHAADRNPSTLSGGERQRLAIARSCLAQKKVLFLDEPTASLDEENKKAVFELLREISHDTLVICSSHDDVAKTYADETITFFKCTETGKLITPKARNVIKRPSRTHFPEKSIRMGKYLRKWFTSGRRNRSSEVKFCVFLTLAVMLIMLGDLPDHKNAVNYEKSYQVNALLMTTFSQEPIDCDALRNMPGVKDVVLSYSGSYPTTDTNDPVRNEYRLYTLPSEEDLFPLVDRIEYGHYFTGEDQILLPWNTAESMSPGNHGTIIGHTVTLNVWSRGGVEFEIVGVLGELNRFEQCYLRSLGMDDESVFLNSRLTDHFINDDGFSRDGQRVYHIYFDSYKDASSFYDSYREAFERDGKYLNLGSGLNSSREYETIIMLAIVLLPLSLLITIFTALFYTNLIKTEIAFNNRFIAVFEYSGYSKKKIISGFVALHMARLLVMSLLSFAAGLLLSELVNIVNRRFVFIGFQPFTFNGYLVLSFFGLVIGLSWLSVSMSLRHLKVMSWYENILRQRDLI